MRQFLLGAALLVGTLAFAGLARADEGDNNYPPFQVDRFSGYKAALEIQEKSQEIVDDLIQQQQLLQNLQPQAQAYPVQSEVPVYPGLADPVPYPFGDGVIDPVPYPVGDGPSN